MKKLNLISFASQLNKQGSLRTAHSELFAMLDARYEVNVVQPDDVNTLDDNDFRLVFVSSGGVESRFRDYYDRLPQPITLLTDGLQNSLAASLEISSWVSSRGAACRIIHGDERVVGAELQRAERLYRLSRLLKGKRVGVIGEPSQWLIASGIDRDEALAKWGLTFVDLTLDEVERRFAAVAEQDVEADADIFLSQAAAVREPSRADVVKACRLHSALRQMCEAHRLDAFTIQCFGLIPRIATTGCLALSLLNDEGIVAGCEGDLQTVVTMLVARELTGCPGFMCNPSQVDIATNDIQLAHCTIGLRQTDSYVVRNHFESLSGVAVQGELPEGEYTLVKCGGKELSRYFVSRATLLANTRSEHVCRTQVRLHLDASCAYFLQHPIANHHVLLRGNHVAAFTEFFELSRLRAAE